MTTVAWIMGCADANIEVSTTSTTIQGHSFGTTRTQGCIIYNQVPQWQTTSVFDVRDVSSILRHHLTAPLKWKGLLNA